MGKHIKATLLLVSIIAAIEALWLLINFFPAAILAAGIVSCLGICYLLCLHLIEMWK